MIVSTPAACCSGQLKTHDAINPPSSVRRSPVSVSCPVSSSKLVFISLRTWRAMGASSCTAFSKWASLSLRLAEPPCVPSRRSPKWRIRLVIYAGVALSAIAYLLLRIVMLPVRLLSGRIDYHLALENRPHDTAIYSQCCQIPAEMVHYGMTKTAEIAVARGIAELVAGTGVTVNSILAGPTESEGVGAFVEAMAKQENKSKAEVEKQFFEHVRPSSLLKRFATVDEVAAMAIYLAGEVSSATNGAALRVDGGVVRAIL